MRNARRMRGVLAVLVVLGATGCARAWTHETGGAHEAGRAALVEKGALTALRPPLYLLWKKRAGRSPAGEIELAGRGLVVTSTDNYIRLVDPDLGGVIWKRKLRGSPSTPALLLDSLVVVGHDLPVPSLVALSVHDGAQKWVRTDLRPRGGLVAAGDTLFACEPGRVVALAREDGRTLYRIEFGGRWPAPLAVVAQSLVVCDEKDSVRAFDTHDGHRRWAAYLPGGSRGGAIVDGGEVYVVGTQGQIVDLALATGDEHWISSVPTKVYASPRKEGGQLFVSGLDGRFYVLDAATGQILWSVALSGATRGAPTIAGNIVAVTTLKSTCQLISLDERRVIHTVDLERPSRTPPLVRGNRIYAIDEEGHLYAFESS